MCGRRVTGRSASHSECSLWPFRATTEPAVSGGGAAHRTQRREVDQCASAGVHPPPNVAPRDV